MVRNLTGRLKVDVREVLLKHYEEDSDLFRLLWTHSCKVAAKAADCIAKRGLDVDRDFVYEAAMLHDVGVVLCHAPSIYCYGTLPYICHGTGGRRLLEECGLPGHALVCERHTGSGLSIDDIVKQQLPLPHRNMLPTSEEEQLICYADKFFSKSGDPTREKTVEEVRSSLAKFGLESLARFDEMHQRFC